jgi:hypothetical protein
MAQKEAFFSLTNDPTFLFQTAGSGRENANAIDTVVSILLLLLMIRPEPVWAHDSCISMSKTETKTRCVCVLFCVFAHVSTWSGSRGLRARECERCSHA